MSEAKLVWAGKNSKNSFDQSYQFGNAIVWDINAKQMRTCATASRIYRCETSDVFSDATDVPTLS